MQLIFPLLPALMPHLSFLLPAANSRLAGNLPFCSCLSGFSVFLITKLGF